MDFKIDKNELSKYSGELKVSGIKTYKLAFTYLNEKMDKKISESEQDKIIQEFIDKFCK